MPNAFGAVRRQVDNSAQLARRCHFLLLTPARGRHNAPMNSPAFGLRVASAIFALFAVAHVVRLVERVQVTVGKSTNPNVVKRHRAYHRRHFEHLAVATLLRAPLKSLGVKRSVPVFYFSLFNF